MIGKNYKIGLFSGPVANILFGAQGVLYTSCKGTVQSLLKLSHVNNSYYIIDIDVSMVVF